MVLLQLLPSPFTREFALPSSLLHSYTSSRAAVSVIVEPCCPAVLNCIDVDVHTVVLLGK